MNYSELQNESAKSGSTLRKLFLLAIGIAIGVAAAFAFDFFKWQKRLNRERLHYEKLQTAQRAELIATKKNNALVGVMSDLVDQMNSELNQSSQRTLSDETIARVAALSYSFLPYVQVEGDSIGSRKLSPERGQLLLIISGLRIDTSALAKLFQRVTFHSASLKNGNLENAFLKGVNLNSADLREANLHRANLNEANLEATVLWGANLKGATLVSANLQSTDASWCNLNDANLTKAKVNKALVKSAQLRRTDLRDASLQRVNLNAAMLNDANLERADMLSVMMHRTNLSSANLSAVNLTTSTITEVILSDAVVSQDWFSKLKEWKVTGAKQIEDQYQLMSDTINLEVRYRLAPRR